MTLGNWNDQVYKKGLSTASLTTRWLKNKTVTLLGDRLRQGSARGTGWMMLVTNDDFNNKGPLVKLTGNLDPGLPVLKG